MEFENLLTLVELFGAKRLCAIAERMVGVGMHFDQQIIGACGHGGARHRRHFVAAARAVMGRRSWAGAKANKDADRLELRYGAFASGDFCRQFSQCRQVAASQSESERCPKNRWNSYG